MSDNLDTLREVAEAAHRVLPEPWVIMETKTMHVAVVERSKRDGSIISGGKVAEAGHMAFREHIATFDPPTVLALITELETFRLRFDAMRRQRDGYRNQLRKAEQKISRVQDACESDSYDMHKDYGNGELVVPVDSIMYALDGDTRG